MAHVTFMATLSTISNFILHIQTTMCQHLMPASNNLFILDNQNVYGYLFTCKCPWIDNWHHLSTHILVLKLVACIVTRSITNEIAILIHVYMMDGWNSSSGCNMMRLHGHIMVFVTFVACDLLKVTRRISSCTCWLWQKN